MAEAQQAYAYKDQGADMRITYTALLLTFVLLPVLSCAQTTDGGRSAAIKARQEQEQCLDGKKAILDKALMGAPKFASIDQANEWASQKLPAAYQEAIRGAGADLLKEIAPSSLDEFAAKRQDFWNLLVKVTFLRLKNMPSHSQDDCANSTDEVLRNRLDIKLGLSEKPLVDEFGQLNLHDTYHYDHVFLYMMVLDTTGKKWSKDWLHGFEPM